MTVVEITKADNGFIVTQGTRLLLLASLSDVHSLIDDLWGREEIPMDPKAFMNTQEFNDAMKGQRT